MLKNLFIISFFASNVLWAAEKRAVVVEIYGKGPAVDRAAYQLVRDVFARNLSNTRIDKFVVNGYGIEGGFSACAQLTRWQKVEVLDDIVAEFNAVQPNPRTTSYKVETADACK